MKYISFFLLLVSLQLHAGVTEMQYRRIVDNGVTYIEVTTYGLNADGSPNYHKITDPTEIAKFTTFETSIGSPANALSFIVQFKSDGTLLKGNFPTSKASDAKFIEAPVAQAKTDAATLRVFVEGATKIPAPK